ncbi:hypothetical protein GCM10027275_42420 [Rhabdobacter roseus]|uniref:Phage shock protein PspC (Stress-responsive transcriptional regulator) n=1 Tax=Rhabdobacter roseus TaxID=1655419 RepID=A0A840TQT2_9BACT|nr:PspC domain-containing protein [Rhabdobacter roseus]MBB5286221.1 phage shock protein PspC (stress-responsive transcriptional regulator) [Rhabdobacter roseus]
MEKKLRRIPSEAVLGGVAAGIADYLVIDKTIVRVLWVVLLFLPIPPSFFWTGVLYLILWAALPEGEPTVPGPDAPIPPAGDPAYTPSGTYTEPRDTYRSHPFSMNPSDPHSGRTVKILGGALVLVGIIMLVDELPIWYQLRHYFWPVALIVLGAFLILRQRDKEQSEPIVTPPPVDPFAPLDPDPMPTPPADAPSSGPTWPVDPESPDDKDRGPDDEGTYRVN